MNLFQYTPQVYKGTQVDLPLDFIYKQLEVQQKEFDAQTAAVDKATENFLKIDPGMLTEEAYQRVVQNYLPRLEKIRDNLYNTGNVSMAAPELSKFTTDLAADSEVKNILQDAKLTETYRQALQQGLYTDKDLPGLFDAQGKKRPQVGPNERVQSSWYAPMSYVDPVATIAKEADDWVKANERDNPAMFRTAKDGSTITTQEGIKERKYEKVLEYVNSRLQTFKLDPANQGFFYRATNFKPETFNEDMWREMVSIPIAKALTFENRSIQTQITPSRNTPSSGQGGDGTKMDSKSVVNPIRTTQSAFSPGLPGYRSEFVTSFDDFKKDIDLSLEDMRSANTYISNLSNGAVPAGDPYDINQRNKTREWIFNNYKVENGRWVVTNNVAPPITPEISKMLSQFQNATVSFNNRQQILNDIYEQAEVKTINTAIIKEAERNLMLGKNVPSKVNVPTEELTDYARYSDPAIIEYLTNRGFDARSSEFRDERDRLRGLSPDELYSEISKASAKTQPILTYLNRFKNPDDPTIVSINKYLSEGKSQLLAGTPEGKVYDAFNNISKKIAQISMSQLPDGDKSNDLEAAIINSIRSGGISAIDIGKDEKLDTGDLDENFTEKIPLDKNGNPDYSQIKTSIGYHPKYGVVGFISFGGKHFQVDLDNVNIDEIFTDTHPQYAIEMRMYQQVSESLKRTSMRQGSFNIGNINFTFDLKSKNLSSSNPEFSYEEKFDGTNIQAHTNLGTIFEKALNQANALNTIYDLAEQDVINQYNEEYNQLDYLDSDGEKRIRRERDQRLQKIREARSKGVTIGGSTSGKAQPQTNPLGLGR